MVWEVSQGARHLWISVVRWLGLSHGCLLLGLHHTGTLYIYYVGGYRTDSRTLKIVVVVAVVISVIISGGHLQIRWNRDRIILLLHNSSILLHLTLYVHDFLLAANISGRDPLSGLRRA